MIPREVYQGSPGRTSRFVARAPGRMQLPSKRGKARGTAVESFGGSVLPTDAQVEVPSGQWTQELRSGKRSACGCEVWGW